MKQCFSHITLGEDVCLISGTYDAAIYMLNDRKIIRLSQRDAHRIQSKVLTSHDNILLEQVGISVADMKASSFLLEATPENSKVFKSAWLEVTARCNLRCKHCYLSCETVAQDLPTAYWENVIDYLLHWGCGSFIFLGGEPCLRQDFWHLLKKVREGAPDASICLITNGTTIPLDKLKEIKDFNVQLRISLLGPTAELHDKITGVNGSFDTLIRTMKACVENATSFNIAVTLLPETLEQKEAFIKLVRETVGDVSVKFSVVRPQGRQGCEMSNGSLCTPEKLATNISKKFFTEAHFHHTCFYRKVVFSSTGSVHPCIMSRYVEKVFNEIKDEHPFKVFDEWWNLTKDDIDGCKDCALRYACFDCRGFAQGLLEAPQNCTFACQYAKSQE